MHLDKLLRSNSVKGAEGVGDSNPCTFDIWATNQANHDKLELVQRYVHRFDIRAYVHVT